MQIIESMPEIRNSISEVSEKPNSSLLSSRVLLLGTATLIRRTAGGGRGVSEQWGTTFVLMCTFLM